MQAKKREILEQRRVAPNLDLPPRRSEASLANSMNRKPSLRPSSLEKVELNYCSYFLSSLDWGVGEWPLGRSGQVLLGRTLYQSRYYNEYKLKRKGIFFSVVPSAWIRIMPGREDVIKRCQMIVGKKKSQCSPSGWIWVLIVERGSNSSKHLSNSRGERRMQELIHAGAMQLSEGRPFPSVYRKVSGSQHRVLKPQLSGEINQSRGNGVQEKSCALDQNKERLWIEQDRGTKLP